VNSTGIGKGKEMMTLSKVFAAVVLVLWVVSAGAQEKQIKHTTVAQTSPASGKGMYMNYCAVCHGSNGKGGGPAAEALKTPPSDLTLLAQKNGGKFPAQHVSAVIHGEANLNAHGNKEMPVWGPIFWKMGGGHEGEVVLRVANLTKYIESLQAK
jgi:mono/diheme cytochrome c family protein